MEALPLREGEAVRVEIHKLPDLLELAGSLNGRVRSLELHARTNEGEDLG